MRRMNSVNRIRMIAVASTVAVLLAVSAFLTVPSPIPFTMQTFVLFLSLFVFGGKITLCAVIVYISIGAVGLPVFSGGGAGVGVIFGERGGFVIGFALAALVYWGLDSAFRHLKMKKIIAAISGMVTVYLSGMVWFAFVTEGGSGGFLGVFIVAVLPFLIPDILKIVLAYFISFRIEKVIHRIL